MHLPEIEKKIDQAKSQAREIWAAADDLRHRAWLKDIEVSDLQRKRHKLLKGETENAA